MGSKMVRDLQWAQEDPDQGRWGRRDVAYIGTWKDIRWTIIRIRDDLELWEKCAFSPSERIAVSPCIISLRKLANGRRSMYETCILPRVKADDQRVDDGI